MIYLVGAKHCLPVGMMDSFWQESQQQSCKVANGNDNEVLIKELVLVKPILQFLHDIWWRVHIEGLEQIPEHGPVFIVGNISGRIPWPALMLIYALMINSKKRRVNVFTDMDTIADERVYDFIRSLNFMPWSYDNARKLLEQGELLFVFPEQTSSDNDAIRMPDRLKRFDWTKFLPAIEAGVPIYPLATLGIGERKSSWFSKLTPHLASGKMRLIEPVSYNYAQDRESIQDEAKKIALFAEGEIQAEINRLLRARTRA